MSHSPTSYIDGLPVKISERYKPPPKMSLPQKLAQLLADSAIQRTDETQVYNFRNERAHRQLLADWQANRHQDMCARRQRLYRRQLERQRDHDEREKQKLTAVSYPSADELSSGDDDEDNSGVEANDKTETVTTASSVTSPAAPEMTSAETATETTPPQELLGQQQRQQRFDTILMPTIMPATADANNWTFATSTKATARVLNGLNGGDHNINWSDFENDTSSPFDTIELTAINDLDMLAQVLNLNATPSSPSPQPPTTCDNVQTHSMPTATGAPPTPPPSTPATPTAAATATTTTNPNTTYASTVSNNPMQLHQQPPIQIDNARNANALDAAQMAGSPLNGYIMGSPTTATTYYNGYQMPPPPQQQQQQQHYMNYSQQLGMYQDQPVTVHHHINQQQQHHQHHQHHHHQQSHAGYNGGTATAVYHMHSTASSYSNSFAAPIAMAGSTPMMPFNVMGGGGGGQAVDAYKATSVPDIMRHPTTQQQQNGGGSANSAGSARFF